MKVQELVCEHQKSILLYEDDLALASEIVEAFTAEDHEIAHTAVEDDFRQTVRTGTSCALIMDRMVNGSDSLSLLEEIRKNGERVPVVVISSMCTVDDRIRGLKAGGDDYLVKPFAMGELIARVEALQRRATEDRRIMLKAGPLTIDLIERSAQRGPRVLDLLPREFSLLEYLVRHANQLVTRTMLLADVLNYNVATQTNVIDVHIGNLRRKVDLDGEEKLISNVRGLGFRLDA